jgi:class 3 adenylate cyclase
MTLDTDSHSTSRRERAAEPSTRGYLFADLRGFTDFLELRGAAATRDLLARYRAIARDVAAAEGGTTLTTEGDSVYVALPSASAALRAALALRSACSEPVAGSRIDVGVGIHAGEALELEGAFVGTAVNIAARACALAHSGEIVATATVRELTRSVVSATWRPMGERSLKGVAGKVVLYRVEPTDAGAVTRAGPWPRMRHATPRAWALPVLAVTVIALLAVGTAIGLLGSAPGRTPSASDGSSRAPASSAVVSPQPSAAVEAAARRARLQARLPPSLARGCRAGPDPGAPSAVALTCPVVNVSEPSQMTIYWFYGFPTAADDRVRADASGRTISGGDCAEEPSAFGSWRNGTEPVGLVLCFPDSANQAWLEWTYSTDGISAIALARDRAWRPLVDWWKQIAPVLIGPDTG